MLPVSYVGNCKTGIEAGSNKPQKKVFLCLHCCVCLSHKVHGIHLYSSKV